MKKTYKFFIPMPRTQEELKAQYKRLAMEHHPDRGGDTEAMKAVNNEYDELFPLLKDIHHAEDDEAVAKEKVVAEHDENAAHAQEISGIYQTASKAAYQSVRFLYQKSPSEYLRRILDSFAQWQEPNSDAADIIQVAVAALHEHQTDPQRFAIASKEVRRYIYKQYPKQEKTDFPPLYKSLLKIRKLLKGQQIKASPEQLAELSQIITNKRITMENIELFIAEEKTRAKTSYFTANIYIYDYQRGGGEIVNVNNEISKLIDGMADNDMITNIISALRSPQQKQIIKYLALGYSNSVIAAKMDISEPRVSQHIKRIREIAKALYTDGMNQ